MRHKSPTVHKGPRPSMVSPTRRVTTPTDGASCTEATAPSRRARVRPARRKTVLSATGDHVQHGLNDALDAGFNRSVDAAPLRFDHAPASRDGLVGHPRHAGPPFGQRSQLAGVLLYGRHVVGVHGNGDLHGAAHAG